MRKAVTILPILLFLFFFWQTAVSAEGYEMPEITLPDEVEQGIGTLPESSEQVYTWFDASKLLSRLQDSFGGAFSDALGCFFGLLSVSAVSALMSSLSQSVENKGIANAFGYLQVLTAGLLSVGSLQSVFTAVAEHLQTLSVFAAGVIPVYTGICTAVGMNGLSLSVGSGLSLSVSFLALIAESALLPLLRICFLLGFSSAVSDVEGIGQIASLVRRFFVGIIGAVGALLATVFAFQSVVAAKADSLAGRAFRYVASSALPLVGGALSEASRTLSSAFSRLGGVAGGAGVVSVLWLVLPIMLQLWLLRLAFFLAGAVSDMLCLPTLSGLYRDAGALLGALMAIVALMDAVLIFEFAMLMQVG